MTEEQLIPSFSGTNQIVPSQSSDTKELDLEALREKAKSSLYFFAKGILGYDWLVPHIHLPLAESLQSRKNLRKVFVLPRGWLKTTLCTIAYPMFLSINDPNIRCLIVQNSAQNSFKKLSLIRAQWEENRLLRALFPELLPKSNSAWRGDSVCLNRSKTYPESTYEAAGTNTTIISRHYDVIIEDDTVAPDLDELGLEELIPSARDVEQAIGWHRTNTLPILTDIETGELLVVSTRWYELDLISWIMENEPHYKVLTRACREDSNGNPAIRGEITYPERFGPSVLEQLEAGLGPYLFSCLYMNLPVRSGDMIFKPDWIHYYDYDPPPASCYNFTTIDPATDPELSQSGKNDWTVVITCAKDNLKGYVYVLDYTRIQTNPGEILNALFKHVQMYNPIVVGYEDVAFQRSLDYYIRQMMRDRNIYFILERVPGTHRDKGMKIRGLQPIFANGDIFIKRHMKELVSELLTFPRGQHDDIIDALSMQLSLWRTTFDMSGERVIEDDNPLSFQRAMEEIKRRKRDKKSLVFDPMGHEPLVLPRLDRSRDYLRSNCRVL